MSLTLVNYLCTLLDAQQLKIGVSTVTNPLPLIYGGTAMILMARFAPAVHWLLSKLNTNGISQNTIRLGYVIGPVFLGLGSYLVEDLVFSALEVMVFFAAAFGYLPKMDNDITKRAQAAAICVVITLVAAVYMVEVKQFLFYSWNWLGVFGITAFIPGFIFMKYPLKSEPWMMLAAVLMAANAIGYFVTFGFGHLSLNFLVLNILFFAGGLYEYLQARATNLPHHYTASPSV